MGIYSSVLWRFPSTHKTLGLNISEQTKNKYINKQTNKEIYKQKNTKKTKTRTTKNLKLYNKNQQQHKKQKKKNDWGVEITFLTTQSDYYQGNK